MPNFISEDDIEKAAVELLARKGYRSINCFTADLDNPADRSNRSSKTEVVFHDILRERALLLNPGIPEAAIDEALEILAARRLSSSPLLANKDIYLLIKNGIRIEYENAEGRTEETEVKVIDFNNAENNDFLAVTQLWIKGERYPRRPDVLIYINGLPLVFIELKNSNVKVQNAYDDNLTNYKHDIPQLFNYNAFCVLSNAVETKIGSFTAGYEHFFNWLRPDDETEKVNRESIADKGTSLERLIHGLFPKSRLLDYIENFILYYNDTVKIVAQNHQFLGVNKAVESFKERRGKDGKLGVFWHTQGSGKSFSMIFLSRKIFRKYAGNYTFVIVTDRNDLDGQIYRNFLNTESVAESEAARPKNSSELRDYLGRNKRIIFTLIQKFRYEKGKEYPLLSGRDDIIVIVDEAHRTQYAALAENMRKGLPNAQFFAFTGTPILGRGKQLYKGKTYDWFGGYVSQYNFVQSIDDGATVPLFYQKRVPEVLIQNDDLSSEFYEILEEENLDEKQQERLEREFAAELHVIRRDDRLEKIARDIVEHFPARGYLGKGMVISVDKFTSVKMYNKVQYYWKAEIKKLRGRIAKTSVDAELAMLKRRLEYMKSIEMAVVISEEAGEEQKFDAQDLDIKPHRRIINSVDQNGHDIEYRFKDPADKLQLVFVCAMWLTGFDAESVSTLYLDKPMKDHTLMQTIARANRVTSYTINGVSKKNGEIVDYYNVFRNMRKALSDYAEGEGDEIESPVKDKSEIFVLLDDAIAQTQSFCSEFGINLGKALARGSALGKVGLFDSWANTLLEYDSRWKQFKVYENTVTSLYEACKPEILDRRFRPMVPVIQYLRGVLDGRTGLADIDGARGRINDLLDESVVTSEAAMLASEFEKSLQTVKAGKILDLAKLNFDKMREEFPKKDFKNIEIANLRDFIQMKLEQMLKENSTRADFAEKFQQIIDRYNSGGMTTESYFEELVKYTEEMKSEDERHIREGLSKDELELFDILKKDKMTRAEEVKVKNAAKHLLQRLESESPRVLVQDWFRDGQSRAKVRTAIEKVLDEDLPQEWEKELFMQKCGRAYELVYDYASRGLKWAS